MSFFKISFLNRFLAIQILIIFFDRSNSSCPSISDSYVYPKQFGGDLGHTQITCFDYQNDNAGTERLVFGGQSFSGDVISHVGSAFLILQDALEQNLIFAKEFYNTAANNFLMTSCLIHLPLNALFASVVGPPSILLKINMLDGQILEQKVFKVAPYLTYDFQAKIIQIGFMPKFSQIAVFLTNSTLQDFIYIADMSDLTSNSQNFELFQGNQNIAPVKKMIVRESNFSVTRIDVMGYINTGSGYDVAQNTLESTTMVDGPPWTNKFFTHNNYEELFVAHDYTMVSASAPMRIGCLMSLAGVQSGYAQQLFIYFQQNINSPYWAHKYTLVNLSGTSDYAMCKDAQITSDFRYFITYSKYIGSLNQLILVEIDYQASYGTSINITQTVLHSYSGSYPEKASGRIFQTASQALLFYSINGLSISSWTPRSNNNGYLMKGSLLSSFSAPILSTLNCETTSPSFTSITSLTTFQTTSWAVNTINTSSTYTLINDNAGLANVKMMDLLQTRMRTSGCPGSPPPSPQIPKYIPYIFPTQYYYVGFDLPIKTYPLTVNASWSTLSTCKQNLLTYDLRMKVPGTALPSFVQFNRTTLQIEVHSAVSANVGTYALQVLVKDIYGQFEAADVTLIVENLLTTPPGIGLCYSENGVLSQGFAQDTLYLIGTLKHTKFHIPVPMTSGYVSCEKLLTFQVELMDSASTVPTQLPWFMEIDTANRQLVTYLPKSYSNQYDRKVFNIKVRMFIRGRDSVQTSFTFKVAMVSTQQMDCPYYYPLTAPVIMDQIFASNSSSTSISYEAFQITDLQCNQTAQLRRLASLYQGTGTPNLPDCIQIGYNEIRIYPAACVGAYPITYKVRLEAYAEDPQFLIKYPNNFTDFTVVIVSASNQCRGQLQLYDSSLPKYYIQRWSNVDRPLDVGNYYNSWLSVHQPWIQYNHTPPAINCESIYEYHSVKLYQDNEFSIPLWIFQWYQTFHSYYVYAASQTAANIGHYEFRMISRYNLVDGITPYKNILSAMVFLKYDVYSEGACKFAIGSQPSILKYEIKKKADILTFKFSPFYLTTEGCIYDKITYTFATSTGAALPTFISKNEAGLSITVMTNKVINVGTHQLMLSGALNPYLVQEHGFTLILTEYPYPNTEAPKIMQPLLSPLKVTLNAEMTYRIPPIKDPDDDPYNVEVLYGGKPILPDFMTFQSALKVLKVAPTEEKTVGSYLLQFKITDQHSKLGGGPKSRTYDFEVIVEKFNIASLQIARQKLKQSQKVQYIGVEVIGVSDQGILTLGFNASLFNSKMPFDEQFNNQTLILKMRKAFSDETYNLPWSLVNFTATTLNLFLNFSNPATVSQYSEKDSLVVKFNKGSQLIQYQVLDDEALFQAMQNNSSSSSDQSSSYEFPTQFVVNYNFYDTRIIPKQKVKSQFGISLSAEVVTVVKGATNGILFGNLIIQILLQVIQSALTYLDLVQCRCYGVQSTLCSSLSWQPCSTSTSPTMQCLSSN